MPGGDLVAHVLLDDFFELDLPEIAAAYQRKFPQFGRVSVADQSLMDAATLAKSMMMAAQWEARTGVSVPMNMECGGIVVEGASFAVRITLCPFLYDLENEGLKPVRNWDPRPVLSRCKAFISIAPVEMAQDIDTIKSQAIVVQTLASFIAIGTAALSIFWDASLGFQSPDRFEPVSASAAAGEMPLTDWLQFYSMVADDRKNRRGEQLSGIATLGLGPFLGREVEIAPRLSTLREQASTAFAFAWLLLQKNAVMKDRDTTGDEDGGRFFTIRLVPHYYRDSYPAYLFISEDSVLDPKTMTQKKKRSFVSRLFRR